jgi:hypothetical protein
MKNICILIAVTLTTFICSPTAYADATIGLGYTTIDSDTTDHTAMVLSGGYNFNEFLGVEGRMVMSPSTETYQGVQVEIDSLYGLYFTAGFPVDNNLWVYALAGHTEAEVSTSFLGRSRSDTESSTSFGAGAKYHIREAYSVSVEVMEMSDDVRAMKLGIVGHF